MFVCVGVLLAYAAKTPSGKILGCIFPIACFVTIGLEHSIANQYLFTAATLLRCDEFHQSDAWGNLFIATAGNILGALILSVTYWYASLHGTELELPEVPHVGQGFILSSVGPEDVPLPEAVDPTTTGSTTMEESKGTWLGKLGF
jgi:hypothetical protein